MVEPVTKAPSRLSKMIDLVLWAAVIGVLALALIPRGSGPNLGQPASSMDLPIITPQMTGEMRTIPGKLERPLLIKAFASWCGACRRDNSMLEDLQDAEKEGKLDVLAVSVDNRPAQALAAKTSWPIHAPVLHDTNGDFNRQYKVEVLPTYILIGTDGRVKRVTSGTAGASDIRAWLHASDE